MGVKKTPKKRMIQVDLDSSKWVAVGRYTVHECCDCGLMHEVSFRYNKRAKRFEERWKRMRKAVRKH
jgi:hypothetical protein